MLDEWRQIRCRPDRYTHPTELAGEWDDAADVGDTDDPDDLDVWRASSMHVDEPTTIEFQGLTFPATVFVDGERVAESESMFLPVRVDVGPGAHDVCVRFGSLNAWLKTRRPRGRWRSSLVAAPGLRWARTTLLGRAPVYGDIPAFVGFWRPVVTTPTRLRTRFTVTADAATGAVVVRGTTSSPDGTRVSVTLRDPLGESLAEYETRVEAGAFTVDGGVDDPQRWWPRGYGAQPLYRVEVAMGNARVAERLFGFRAVTVSTEDAFRILINDVPVFCRGATWSPPDPLRLHVDADVMRDHVKAFADAGATMLRVVGGLVYEQAEFWESCAELGVLVWQDAMLATFDPPGDLSNVIARELETVLDDVSGNPALVVVSGGSETLQQPEMLGLERSGIDMEVIDSVLPGAVSAHSDACYVRASPSPPPSSDDLAIRPDSGVAHWFGVGGYLRPIADVRSAGVGFAAECLAFANPPEPAVVTRHFGSAAVAGHDPRWKAGVPRDRGASWDFEDVRDFYAGAVFGEDLLAVRRVDPERYLALGRAAIAEATGECFRFWRRGDSGCAGALMLSGKDLSPGAGWGLLDVDGTPKATLRVLARVWAPVAVILSDDGLAGVRIDVHNDTPRSLSGQLTVIATNSVGARTVDLTRDVVVAAHSSSTFADAELTGTFRDLSHAFRFGPPAADAIEAGLRFEGDDGPTSVRDVLVVNPHPRQVRAGLRAVATRVADDATGATWELLVSSEVALRYVSIDVPGWTTSDDFFHLAAGCPHVVRLTGSATKPVGTVGSIDLLSAVAIVVAP